MSVSFLVVAGLLALASVAVLWWPLLLRRVEARPSPITAGVIAAAVLAGGAGLYVLFSSYDWQARPEAGTPAVRAAALAKRLAKSPDDLGGWLELGQQYTALEQYPLAVRAYQRADAVSNGTSAEAVIGLAESLLAIDIEDIRGRSGRLFDRVLEIDPDNLKGLFYGAIAAFSRGDTAQGRERFERLLATNPPAHIRTIIEKQLEAIEAGAMAAAPSTAGVPGATAPSRAAAAPPSDEARVRVRVSVSPALAFQLTRESALFVLARDPAQPGPPFAAKRLPVELPAEVTLTAADAMLEQRRLTAGQTVEVVARISLSGQPQSTSGDPFGQVTYQVGKDGTLELRIDRLAP